MELKTTNATSGGSHHNLNTKERNPENIFRRKIIFATPREPEKKADLSAAPLIDLNTLTLRFKIFHIHFKTALSTLQDILFYFKILLVTSRFSGYI